MELRYREQQAQTNNIVSMNQSNLTKPILQVYEYENLKLVTEAAARTLHLLEQQCIIIENKKYYVITEKIIDELEKAGFEIQYLKIVYEEEKELLNVLCYNDQFYIDAKLLNNLDKIDYERIDFTKNKYGPLTSNELDILKTIYNVEFVDEDSYNNDISESKKK